MARTNPNFKNLSKNYLFSETDKRVKLYLAVHPRAKIFNLGVGNTTEPIVHAVIKGLKSKVRELSKRETYTGYGDSAGDVKLRESLSKWYGKRGVEISPSEIFISDGAKSDCANISSIFAPDSRVAICDPVYPVYRDANLIAGKKLIYLAAKEENGFFPSLPEEKVDLIFLCSPNNPTGATAKASQLREFVDYAQENKALIIFDAAYSEYIQEKNLPKSIYQIEGSRKCAIEIQSLSKSAGFTGIRLGWTIVPNDLITEDASGEGEINRLWRRRQSTMFNGASNIAQEGGLAVFSEAGQKETRKQIKYYLENANLIKEGLERLKLKVFGGVNAPYLWAKCPRNLSSWEFFDKLLKEAQVISTPGAGFGICGEGYVRFSAFGRRKEIKAGIKSLKENLRRGL
ncbi:LL-diaminopimelate aminotransferase [Patescibacteria group bacterium]|nr:LL-diaminopimelate aminotransferase [Patescibacteria group bacterium]MBU4481579.1 LL-diaminopimelate aminotransferase [Patescibacteria group bacterium]